MRPAGPGFVPPPGGEPDAAAEPGFLRTSATIAGITALARVAGFARWIVLGITVGTTFLGNTYQTANWVPNIMFELVAGGVLSAVFVPTFVSELERGRERGFEIASTLANAFLLASIPLVVVGIVAGRPIMRALTVGVADPAIRAQEIELGAWFLRFFIPQIPLYVLAMLFTGILHAHRRFAIPAAAPLFSSLIVIGTYLTFNALGAGADLDTVSDAQRWVLAGGTTAGVVVLAFSQLPSVLRVGVRWKPVLHLRDPAVRRAFRAGGWGMAYFGVTEIGLIVTLVLANRVEGGVIAFQVAYAFFELPNALVGLPVAVALFPSMAERFARGEEGAYARLVSDGWRAVTFLAAPAGAGLAVLGPSLADALLGPAGAQASPGLVGAALRGLGIGLPAWALVATLTRAFYARHDTRPPVALNAASVSAYALLAVPLTIVLAPAGAEALGLIGAAFGAGQWAGILVGAVLLARRVPGWEVRADLRAFGASLARAAAMGVAVWFLLRSLSGLADALRVVAGVGAGALVYLGLSVRSPQLRRSWVLLRKGTS